MMKVYMQGLLILSFIIMIIIVILPPTSVDACVRTTDELVVGLEDIKQTVDRIGVIQLCRTTLAEPLRLDRTVILSGDDYTSVTIGCEGQNSMSLESPACGITRSSFIGFFEVFTLSGGTDSDFSFQFENLVVDASLEPDIPYIEAQIPGTMLSIINCEFRRSNQGTRPVVDVLLVGNTILGITRSIFDGGDLQVGKLTTGSSTGGSINIDSSIFTGNRDEYVCLTICHDDDM